MVFEDYIYGLASAGLSGEALKAIYGFKIKVDGQWASPDSYKVRYIGKVASIRCEAGDGKSEIRTILRHAAPFFGRIGDIDERYSANNQLFMTQKCLSDAEMGSLDKEFGLN
jgi:hypothetical protein